MALRGSFTTSSEPRRTRPIPEPASAEPFPPYDDVIARKLDELDEISEPATALVGSDQVDRARSRLRALDSTPPPRRVPCHLDFSPRNWLVDDGLLHVVDFGDAAPDA